MNKKILFRADGNSDIGLGHIMRCLSIADSFSASGCDVAFVLADESVEDLVRGRGYVTFVLHTDYRNMDGELPAWRSGAMPVFSFSAADNGDFTDASADGHDGNGGIVIVDSYFVTEGYLVELRRMTGGRLVYIDDVFAFAYPVDVLVNYNAYGPSVDYALLYRDAGVVEPEYLLGVNYSPLRRMFRGVEKRVQPERVGDVLISTGGADPYHIALEVVRTIRRDVCIRSRGDAGEEQAGDAARSAEADDGGRNYHILVGRMNGDRGEIVRLASGSGNIFVHEDVADMRGLLCGMDIAVSAAGSTMYEICACGVPLITYVTADNQIPGAEAFEGLELAESVGDVREFASVEKFVEKLLTAVDELAGDYDRRVEVGRRMQEMIDGYGADRMVKEILW